MADDDKAAATKADENKVDPIQGVINVAKIMRKDARLFDASFLPRYNYDSSALKSGIDTLISAPNTGIPSDIQAQVAKLAGHGRSTVDNIVANEYKPKSWEAPFDAIEKSINDAKAKPQQDREAGQSDASLDNLKVEIVKLKAQALDDELRKMHANLVEQNKLNSAKAFAKLAMAEGPYKDNGPAFMANDWVNESNRNDEYSNEDFENVAMSTDGRLQKGSDGVYSRPDSFYKVSKTTDKSGNAHYEATYSNQPKGEFQECGEALIKTAVMLTRIIGAPVIIPLEMVSVGLAAIGWALTLGRLTPPYSMPGSQFLMMDKGIFEERKGNIRDTVLAEIDVARNRGRERDMYVDVSRTEGKEINTYDLEKVVVYLDELKKRAKYVPGADGQPGQIMDAKNAMGLNVGSDFQHKLRALDAKEPLTDETKAIVREFYKSQNNGSMAGFKESQYKEYIIRDLLNFTTAKQHLDHSLSDKNKAANTSSITGEQPTTGSTITPSAPPFEDQPLSKSEQTTRSILMSSFKVSSHKIGGDTFQDVVQNAITKFDALVTETHENGKEKPDADVNKVKDCKDLQGRVEDAVSKLTGGEKTALEEQGTLGVYTQATVRMTGHEPGKGPTPTPNDEGTLQAGVPTAPRM